MRTLMGRWLLAAAVALFVQLSESANAQGRFAPELQVGDEVITRYQIDQRERFLTLLGASGNVRRHAREQLINETVQRIAAQEAGVRVTPAQVDADMEEFAARVNLLVEDVMAILEEAGIERESFRAFIEAGVAWRQLVRSQFGESVRASISDRQIRRALATTGTEGGTRVLVSEIILPAGDSKTAIASRKRAVRIAALQDENEFAAAARSYSIAASANRGGEVDWQALDALPEIIGDTVAALEIGKISRPLDYEGNIAIFLLRDMESVQEGTNEALLVDYALLRLEGGADEAAEIARAVDECDDLYRVARDLPKDRLIREAVPTAALPADVRSAVANLDDNEISTALVRDGNVVVLMLCERRPTLKSNIDFDIVGGRLLNQRLNNTAAHYLAELRASTNVIDLTN